MRAKTAKIKEYQFQAETKKLLDIMIHSLYTNKEIFLRELISNASDALDRLRFETLTDPTLLEENDKYEIRLETDKEARTLSISDTGIGMSREEVMANIGTIAKSAADGTYLLSEAERDRRGTTVTLYLKQADSEISIEDFTDQWVLSRIVRKY